MACKRKNEYLFGPENHGRTSEKKVAKRLGARPTRASGAGYEKGDSVLVQGNLEFRLESKATIHDSLSVKRAWLDKIAGEAVETGKYPGLTINFVDKHGKTKHNGAWVAIPEYLFKELVDRGSKTEG